MRINHNIAALNTYRQLTINNENGQKSLEKLSSGMRINRAGDDAAGLAISEKMRGQIRGLTQASRNAQDGISMIQTAEGALNETHSILQRMRELADQAANDTNTDTDRGEIQKEINQLTSEINRIGNTTEFNTKKLLNAGSINSDVVDKITTGLKEKGWLELAEQKINDAFGLQGIGTSKITVEFKGSIDKAAAFVTYNTGNKDLSLTIDVSDFEPATGESGTTTTGFQGDRYIAHEMVHAVMSDSLGADKMMNMQQWFKEGTAEFIPGADERLKGVIGSGGALDPTKRDALIDRAVDLLGGATWNGDNDDYAAGYLITKYLDNSLKAGGDTFEKFFNTLETSSSSSSPGDKMVEEAILAHTGKTLDAFKTDFEVGVAAYIGTLELNFTGAEQDTGSILGSDHEGATNLNAEDVIDNSLATDIDGEPLQNFNIEFKDFPASEFKLQIGANTGQSFNIAMEDMRSEALYISGDANGEVTSEDGKHTAHFTRIDSSDDSFGVTNGTDDEIVEYALDVSTHENATAAISIYQDAIDKVSSFRSKLGAYQNRLEHTINNLGTSAENLTAAESRIRDVDMAKEMMTHTKNNILAQAAQSMLAQANQQPQGVLQLLR